MYNKFAIDSVQGLRIFACELAKELGLPNDLKGSCVWLKTQLFFISLIPIYC